MGADSAAVSGWEREEIAVPKLFSLGPLLVGVAGAPRVADVLRYAPYESPLFAQGASTHKRLHAALVSDFVPWLRRLSDEEGLTAQDEGHTVLVGNTALLVGCCGLVFTVNADFAVITFADGYTAIGTGAPYALGALFLAAHGDPAAAVLTALQASAKYCTRVFEPFKIMEQRG
jgi:hypothetical protein